MEKLFVLFVLAVVINQALCMNLRHKRQSDDSGEEDLEDRYGWNRPQRPFFNNQGQFGNQGQFPNQGQFGNQGQFPNQGQFGNQGQFPNQGQFGNQGQFPNQGQFGNQGQFPNQGQNNQGQFPNQGQSNNNGQFPNQGQTNNQGQFPNQGQTPNQGQQQQTTTTVAPSGSTTVSAAIQQCMRSCLVTSEYNPVCGSDNQTYTNIGRLTCARDCGLSVTQVRSSPCPATTPAPTS